MGGIKELIRFVRVGTLDNPDLLPPDIHIYTSSKQPWVILPANSLMVSKFYDYDKIWSKKNLTRKNQLMTIANGKSNTLPPQT